jgi:hypothetical protein
MSETTTQPTPTDEPDKGSGVCAPGEGKDGKGATGGGTAEPDKGN